MIGHLYNAYGTTKKFVLPVIIIEKNPTKYQYILYFDIYIFTAL